MEKFEEAQAKENVFLKLILEKIQKSDKERLDMISQVRQHYDLKSEERQREIDSALQKVIEKLLPEYMQIELVTCHQAEM